jgi:hypothetical protein
MENAEALLVASNEIALELDAEKPKYMVMYGEQNVGRSYSVKVDNS